MLRDIKIYTRSFYDTKTKQTWYFQKGVALNNRKDLPVYADIKWFVKRDTVDKLLGDNMGGYFQVNISKVRTREYLKKDGLKGVNYTFEINDIKPLEPNSTFEKELSHIISDRNSAFIEEVFEF